MSVKNFRVYITRLIPQSGLKRLQDSGAVVEQHESVDAVPRNTLLSAVKGINGLFCLITEKIDSELLDAAGPKLKVVCTMSSGYDHIDLEECKKRGIKVGYAPDVSSAAVAEYTIGLLLTTSRRLVEGMQAVKNGTWVTWKPMWLHGKTLDGSTVGIVGLGHVGRSLVEKLRAFNVSTFLYCGSHRQSHPPHGVKYTTFEDLLARSDFVVSCCSLNDSTRDMFNEKAFSLMRTSSIFVNVSRGDVVDHTALFNALSEGSLAGAGLDVTSPEPLPIDSPLIDLPNCIVLPHIASATRSAREEMSAVVAKNIIAALEGKKMSACLV